MPGQQTDHLPRNLQVRYPSVEVNPVKTLQIQTSMASRTLFRGRHTSCHGLAPQVATPQPCNPASPHPRTIYQHHHQPRQSEAQAL